MSLAEEVETLDQVRAALDRGEPQAALSRLDAYHERGSRRLASEAALLRIEALARAGKDGEAAELARRFISEHPTSPLVDRARAFVEPKAP